eukprot:15435114-Alexandrium_andersonii.AAC.1
MPHVAGQPSAPVSDCRVHDEIERTLSEHATVHVCGRINTGWLHPNPRLQELTRQESHCA